MNSKQKSVLIGSLTILMGVMLIISLAFCLNEAYGSWYWICNGYYGVYKDTGFSVMSFSSNLPLVDEEVRAISVVLGIFAYVQLFLGIATIVFGIMYIIKSDYIWNKLVKIFMIIAVSYSAWYFIEGLLYTKILTSVNGATTKTLAWLSFLFGALIFIAYMLCKYLIKPKDEINETVERVKTVASVKSQTNRIELLKQYKELLDNGIISQEEFEEKKSELL